LLAIPFKEGKAGTLVYFPLSKKMRLGTCKGVVQNFL
jgi:hypothetical protein